MSTTTPTTTTPTTAAETVTLSITIPARITRKVAGYTYTIETARIHPDVLRALLPYGIGRGVNDPANSTASAWRKANNEEKTTLPPRSLIEPFVEGLYDGTLTERTRAAAGSSILDPVQEEARTMALMYIQSRLGIETKSVSLKSLFATTAGAKYVTQSDKGVLSRNEAAIDLFIETNEAKLGLLAAAKVVVAARNVEAPGEEDIAI